MILTGNEIMKRLNKEIFIEPFNPERVNPNSYNLSLADELMVYTEDILDPKKENKTDTIIIPEEGYMLEPGKVYLARTSEYTKTFNLVPMIIGRSSLGRLGLAVHVTSGFGDVGFCGYWTMQLICVQRMKIYPGMKICQIFYHTVCGDTTDYSSDKYQNSGKIVASKIFQEF
jgi:dCTP deaminase